MTLKDLFTAVFLAAMALFFTWIAIEPAEAAILNVATASEARAAIHVAKRGDTVKFAPGTYRLHLATQRSGVTFKGAPNYASVLLYTPHGSGKQIASIRHPDTTIEGFAFDGEERPNSGHGLIRIGTSSHVLILRNKIENSGSGLISIGGSWKNSKISDVKIIGNILCHSGFKGEHGEPIYIGDYKGSGSVRDVEIAGNEICQFTDNAIDLKPPASNVHIHHNYIHDQIERRHKKEVNTGTLVAQGNQHRFHDNIVQDVIAGKAVFNLTSHARTEVKNNVIVGVRKTNHLVRKRANGDSSLTMVEQNQFCITGTKSISPSKGIIVRKNAGVDLPSVNCQPRIATIMETVKSLQAGEPEPIPTPLADLKISKVTYGETGPNVIRIYVETIDSSEPRITERHYTEGSVTFWNENPFRELIATPAPQELAFRRQKPSPPGRSPGWNFYLSPPFEFSKIKMIAAEEWITGAPAIDQIIPYFGTDVPPPPVTLTNGQQATCAGKFVSLGPKTMACHIE